MGENRPIGPSECPHCRAFGGWSRSFPCRRKEVPDRAPCFGNQQQYGRTHRGVCTAHPVRGVEPPAARGVRVSKISDLRRQAQQELRARRYDKAVALYEQICDSEKSNAGYRNELGDIHLKMGELPRAVECFREAAGLYRAVGLTNNAVAILKKVLRQDPHHFDSLWELAEIRSEQGLETEAVRSFLDYLRTADVVPEEGRSAFLRRSSEVLERWGDEPEVLSELDGLFERWDAQQERAQVLVAKASLARREGETDIAAKYIDHARSVFEQLDALPAYVAYRDAAPPEDLPQDLDFEDLHSASTDSDGEEGTPISGRVELDASDMDLGFDLGGEDEEVETEVVVEIEDGSGAEEASQSQESPEAEGVVEAAEPSEAVDLLDAILSDGDLDLGTTEEEQLETIAAEMEGQMADHVDPDDHAGQYDLGMVYADMGLTEQAVQAFLRASESEEFRMRALEMAANCRLETGDAEGAIELFQRGLEVLGHPESAYMGLLYGLGQAYEARDEVGAAIESFERVAIVDASFRDVGDHLRQLHAAHTEP